MRSRSGGHAAMRAVILAAGDGGRLGQHTAATPKPLVRLNGRPLVSYTLDALASAGIEEAVVVIGYRGDQVRSSLGEGTSGIDLTFVVNPHFEGGASLSLRAARPICGEEPFLLVMSDHMLSKELIERLLDARRTSAAAGRSFVAADSSEHDLVYIDESTKIATESDSRVTGIGKTLDDWQALDCGAFLLTREVWGAVDASPEDCELSTIFGELARRGGLYAADVGDAFWYDVDTPLDLLNAADAIAARRPLPARIEG